MVASQTALTGEAWRSREPVQGDSVHDVDAQWAKDKHADEVLARASSILGYDVIAWQLMDEGYREFAAEAKAIAEESTAVFFENLPPE